MFGSHLSIAGGLVNALHEARRLRMDCVQVFTKNQRQWKVPPLLEDDRQAWLQELKAMGWHRRRGPARVISHNSYLINLASPDTDLRRRSIALQREELERCEALRIPCCVSHPGAHMGKSIPRGQPHELGRPPRRDEHRGLMRIVRSLDRIHRDLPGYQTVTCLETTVGSGTNLGYDFGQLALIREAVGDPDRIGFCFDTCHVTAAGYDMSTEDGAKTVMQKWRAACGDRALKVVHVNDSMGALGSRRDRHTHIGDGACGRSCFQLIVNHRLTSCVPKILETPKGRTERGSAWDLINIRRLKRLITCP